MKHYAGLGPSMESKQVHIVDENGRKLVSEKVEFSRGDRRDAGAIWTDRAGRDRIGTNVTRDLPLPSRSQRSSRMH